MAKTSAAIVKITDSAMGWREVDLNELLACCKRELAFRERVYPRWVEKGTLTDNKAAHELETMRQCVEFLVHCVFKAVTRGAAKAEENWRLKNGLTYCRHRTNDRRQRTAA